MTDNTIDVDAVWDAQTERRRVNSIDIMDAVFVSHGEVLEVSCDDRALFKFTGLNNVDFVINSLDR